MLHLKAQLPVGFEYEVVSFPGPATEGTSLLHTRDIHNPGPYSIQCSGEGLWMKLQWIPSLAKETPEKDTSRMIPQENFFLETFFCEIGVQIRGV